MSDDNDQKYHLTYKLTPHPEGVTKENVPEGHGACDAAIICSMIYPPDGSFSLAILGADGRTPDQHPSDKEIFKVWMLMASRLAESKTLPEGRRRFAEDIWNLMREIMFSTKPPLPDEPYVVEAKENNG